MTEPMWNQPDEEFVRRLQDEQSEAEDLSYAFDDRAADLTLADEPDTSPENT